MTGHAKIGAIVALWRKIERLIEKFLATMTHRSRLVIVIEPTLSDIRARLEAYIGDISGQDARSERRRLILEAATELFTRNGYRNTSIDQVAEAAGIAKGTVYLHFKTKIELLIAATSVEKYNHLDKFAGVFDERRSAVERLQEWVSAMLLLPQEMPLASKLFQGNELAAIISEIPVELMTDSEKLSRAVMGNLLRQVAPHRGWTDDEIADRTTVLTSLSLMGGQLADDRVRRGLSLQRFAGILGRVVTDGIVGPIMTAVPLARSTLARSADAGHASDAPEQPEPTDSMDSKAHGGPEPAHATRPE